MNGLLERFPNTIFNYLDYRNFLTDIYTWGKRHKRGFNLQFLAELTGFKSVSYLKMVMDGQRNLSTRSTHMIATGLELGKKESTYFETLVQFNQARSESERSQYRERLVLLRPRTETVDLSDGHLEYFTKPHHVAIREMIALPEFNEDLEWIARHLLVPVKPRDIEESLKLLTKLGLIKRNAAGKLVQKQTALSSPPETEEFLSEVYAYHRDMLSMAGTSLVNVAHDRRDVSGITVPVSVAELGKIKELILEFREKILSFVNQLPPTYDTVYQLNIQLFPLTQTLVKMENPAKS